MRKTCLLLLLVLLVAFPLGVNGQPTVIEYSASSTSTPGTFVADASYTTSLTLYGMPFTFLRVLNEFGQWTEVTASNPLPVETTVTIGSVTVNPEAPLSTMSVTSLAVTSASQLVASLTDRRMFQMFNIGTETMWIAVNSTVATVGVGVPVLTLQYYSEALDSDIPVAVIASTPTTATVIQGY